MARGYLSVCGEGVRVYLRGSPGAKKTESKGLYGARAVKLSVSEVPVEGRANAGVERFLAEAPSVSASRVEVVRGGAGRDKVALVRGASEAGVGRALDGLLGG